MTAPSPPHLRQAAAANSAVRRHDAETAISADRSGLLRDFRDFASTSAFSTNVDAAKILPFADAGEVLDGRRFDIHRAGGDVSAGLAAFADRQGAWLVRREAFESLWEEGDRLVYGAVNAGGLGTRGRYGEFCLIVLDTTSRARAAAAFPGDSAQRYTDADGNVDAARALVEVTAWTDRDALAVVERGPEALALPPDEWPRLICSPDRYLEAVLRPPIPIEDIVAVPLPQTYSDRLTDLQVRELAGDDLTPVERQEVLAFSALQGWRSAHGTTLEGLAS